MTPRDQQIAELRRAGKSQREIGRTLGISHVMVGKRLRALAVVTTNGTPDPDHRLQTEAMRQALEKIRALATELTHAWNPAWLTIMREKGRAIADLAERALQRLPLP